MAVWRWNYYYTQVRRDPGPRPHPRWASPMARMVVTIDEYWAAITGHGLGRVSAAEPRVGGAYERSEHL